jgi:simple sugar transport system permease protein
VGFEMPDFSRDMVVTLQGFVILFSGAMTYVLAPTLSRVIHVLPVIAKRRPT